MCGPTKFGICFYLEAPPRRDVAADWSEPTDWSRECSNDKYFECNVLSINWMLPCVLFVLGPSEQYNDTAGHFTLSALLCLIHGREITVPLIQTTRYDVLRR